MSKYIVDIHGDIEGDYDIVGKYEEPKTGHWTKEFNDMEGEVRFTCSSCGKYQLFPTDFCPECGAKMANGDEVDL